MTSHCGHFRNRPFGSRHVGGQKCIVMIERKALNVTLFTNASDYSNKTCMDRFACLYLTNNGGFVGVFTCIGEQRYDYRLSLNHCNTFLTPNEAAAKRTYTKCDVTVQWVYCSHHIFTPCQVLWHQVGGAQTCTTQIILKLAFVLQCVLTNFHLHCTHIAW